MAAPTVSDVDAALRAWLTANGLLGDFARGGRSSATLRLMWGRQFVPGFNPAIPDWFVDFPGEKQGEDILARAGMTPAEIAAEKDKPPKAKGS